MGCDGFTQYQHSPSIAVTREKNKDLGSRPQRGKLMFEKEKGRRWKKGDPRKNGHQANVLGVDKFWTLKGCYY